MKNSLIAGCILSVISSLLSFFVVLRRLSFLSVGISHSALAGVAIGYVFGLNVSLTTFIFCAITGYFIGKLTQMGNVENDTSIGIFFAFTMAVAIFFIYFGNVQINLVSYLFGSIVGISFEDVLTVGIVGGIFVVLYFIFFKELLCIAFDRDIAKVSGIKVEVYDSFFLVVLSTIIVLCIKLTGIILTSAFLILPATFSMNISKDYRKIIFLSVIFSITSFLCGFFLSFYFNIPVGATIVVSGTILYFLSIPFSKLCK